MKTYKHGDYRGTGATILRECAKQRNNSGILQRELETITGITRPHLSEIERGKRDILMSTYLKYLEALGITMTLIDKNGRVFVTCNSKNVITY